MSSSAATPLQRVRQVLPDLEVSSLRAGEDGLINDVIIVNDELVFRFARTDAGREALERESRVLARIRPRVSLGVPDVVHRSQECLVYRFIPGIPLSRHELLGQEPATRAALIDQLGSFLRQLHAIPLGSGDADNAAIGGLEEHKRLYHDLERELMPHMMAWARVWAREHFRPVLEGRIDVRYTPALIHGDLAPYHLCFDPKAKRLNGVIDFGEAGPGDPAADLGSIINAYGESVLWQMATAYPSLPALIDRARFLAGTLELRWGLAAIRTRDPAWFLCHLGYARDAWPIGWQP
jgi:aminoglycoside 2''-phosphotransferase